MVMILESSIQAWPGQHYRDCCKSWKLHIPSVPCPLIHQVLMSFGV